MNAVNVVTHMKNALKVISLHRNAVILFGSNCQCSKDPAFNKIKILSAAIHALKNS